MRKESTPLNKQNFHEVSEKWGMQLRENVEKKIDVAINLHYYYYSFARGRKFKTTLILSPNYTFDMASILKLFHQFYVLKSCYLIIV